MRDGSTIVSNFFFNQQLLFTLLHFLFFDFNFQGLQLCEYLISNYGSFALSWFPMEWQELLNINFVPCWNLKQLPMCYSSYSSSASSSFSPLRVPNKKILTDLEKRLSSNSKKKTGGYSGKGTGRDGREDFCKNQAAIYQLLQDERTEAMDVEGEGSTISVPSMLQTSLEMMASAAQYNPKKEKNLSQKSKELQELPTYHVNMTSLRGKGNKINLSIDSHLCWTVSNILPSCFNYAPVNLLRKMNVSHPPSCAIALKHLKEVSILWKKNFYLKQIPKSSPLLSPCKGVVLGCCAIIGAAMEKNHIHMSQIRSNICHSAFVVMDDGRCIEPSHLCVDLETHLSDLALAPPSYLPSSLHAVLNAAGSSSISGLEPPQVSVKGNNCISNVNEMIQNMCLSSDLSDVVLVHSNGEKHYAHKLIVALGSNTLKAVMYPKMDTSAMSSSTLVENNQRRTQIKLPEWADSTAVVWMLQYLYGCGNVVDMLVPSGETIGQVCSLLRLTDFFELEHLKSLVEVWLSSSDIVDVFNVVGLLTHAHACRAKQLTRYAVFCCREMFSVVSETNEWQDIDEGLKKRVMDLNRKGY